MKIQLSAALLAVLVLGGCAPQTNTNVADASQAAPKKKCDADATTGSRMRSCNGMSSDSVGAESGDAYRATVRGAQSASKSD